MAFFASSITCSCTKASARWADKQRGAQWNSHLPCLLGKVSAWPQKHQVAEDIACLPHSCLPCIQVASGAISDCLLGGCTLSQAKVYSKLSHQEPWAVKRVSASGALSFFFFSFLFFYIGRVWSGKNYQCPIFIFKPEGCNSAVTWLLQTIVMTKSQSALSNTSRINCCLEFRLLTSRKWWLDQGLYCRVFLAEASIKDSWLSFPLFGTWKRDCLLMWLDVPHQLQSINTEYQGLTPLFHLLLPYISILFLMIY